MADGKPLYGAGLRLMECLRLRVKDVDFGYGQILMRDSEGVSLLKNYNKNNKLFRVQ